MPNTKIIIFFLKNIVLSIIPRKFVKKGNPNKRELSEKKKDLLKNNLIFQKLNDRKLYKII